MSTEYYPYPAYHPQTILGQPPQSAARVTPAVQGGYYPAGAYPVPPAYGAYHSPPPGAMPTAAYPGAAQAQQSSPFFNFSNDRFLKGLLIGAAVTYLVTNESVQRTAIKGAVKAWSFLQGGVEEIKERFQDAEAELHAAEVANEESEMANNG